jgi:hypothetical protein
MRRTAIPPPPDSLGGSEHERFQRFAQAILAVPKSEVAPPEEALAKLEAQKQRIDAKIAEVGRQLGKRKISRRKEP